MTPHTAVIVRSTTVDTPVIGVSAGERHDLTTFAAETAVATGISTWRIDRGDLSMTAIQTTAAVPNNTYVQTARDLALLVARIGLGVIMLVHAKLVWDFAGSVSGVVQGYGMSGVPLPVIAGPLNLFVEVVGGVAMILGVAVRLTGVLMALNMVGAWIIVHPHDLFALDHTGPETVIAVGLLSLILVVTGSGRFAIDYLIAQRRIQRKAGATARGV
jgi:putative oxidoreductase